jgi:CheY-like chemotaxis protein
MEVLLVDDQATTVQVYAASVRKTFNGAKVHTAVDLPEALQIASGHSLDLVLLDLALPTCDGIDALERFRKRFPAVPVLVVSASEDKERIRACLEAVAWADELIVVDSFSTDATAAISREFTDKIYQHEFHGFGRLRNEAVARASHDWVFSLDTDERITPELRDAEFDAPQGRVRIDPTNNHTYLWPRVARLDARGTFQIVWNPGVRVKPDPYCVVPSLDDWSADGVQQMRA